MSTHRKAVLFMLITVVLWSTSGLAIKASSLGALAIVGGRSAIAAVVLLVYLRRPRWTGSMPQIGGAIAYVVMQLLFVQSMQSTSAANAILLQYTAPIWVALFGAWFLGERPQSSDWITMGVMGAGMLLFFGDALTTGGMIGNVLAILSGVAMAWMTLFLRKQKDGSPLETILLGNILGAVIGLPFLLTSQVTRLDWGIVAFLGIFQLGLPFLFYAYAIKNLTALEVVLISELEPILNPLWVFLATGEKPGRMAVIGGLVVLGAVLVRALAGSIAWRPAVLRRSARSRAVS